MGRNEHHVVHNPSGGWRSGSIVNIFPFKGEDFLRADGNKEEKDNLGDLPECNC
ncbi:MAG: DUF3892 domain-containing protein [Clostridia bacterium]